MQFSVLIFVVVLVLGIVQLGVGVVFGRYLVIRHAKEGSTRRREAKRLQFFARRFRDLVARVAEDIDEHHSQIKRANHALSSAEGVPDERLTEFVLKSVSQIMQINERLHTRLTTAEGKLESQTEQIETHLSQARTDPLTGLPNRRAFYDELNRRIAEWRRTGATFCMLMIDIDNFKRINDQFGHPTGDEVLRRVSEAFKSAFREMDTIARIGGEEFAVVLPATNATDACIAVERCRASASACSFECEAQHVRVTVSLGLAAVATDDDAVSLVKRADEALYAAKHGGRNCGFVHNGRQSIRIEPSGRTEADRSQSSLERDQLEDVDMAVVCGELRQRITEIGGS